MELLAGCAERALSVGTLASLATALTPPAGAKSPGCLSPSQPLRADTAAGIICRTAPSPRADAPNPHASTDRVRQDQHARRASRVPPQCVLHLAGRCLQTSYRRWFPRIPYERRRGPGPPHGCDQSTVAVRAVSQPAGLRRGARRTGSGLWRTCPKSFGTRPTQERAICESSTARPTQKKE
jgi:hypothetical protein